MFRAVTSFYKCGLLLAGTTGTGRFAVQMDFFNAKRANVVPEGLRYQPALISSHDEAALVERVRELPFREFEFHGYFGKRRVVSFGWKYDYGSQRLQEAEEIPDYLRSLRALSALFANLEPDAFEQVLVTEYADGAGIGWHRDKAVFGQVVGVSLLAPCTLRFRRKVDGRWERSNLLAEPRSAYHLNGPARAAWEHSIARVDTLRYSITFRTMRDQ